MKKTILNTLLLAWGVALGFVAQAYESTSTLVFSDLPGATVTSDRWNTPVALDTYDSIYKAYGTSGWAFEPDEMLTFFLPGYNGKIYTADPAARDFHDGSLYANQPVDAVCRDLEGTTVTAFLTNKANRCSNGRYVLFARWAIRTNTVFVSSGTGGSGSSTFTYLISMIDQMQSITLPTREGYWAPNWTIGTGWRGDEEPSVEEDNLIIPAGTYGDFRVTPNWQAKTYAVLYSGENTTFDVAPENGTFEDSLRISWKAPQSTEGVTYSLTPVVVVWDTQSTSHNNLKGFVFDADSTTSGTFTMEGTYYSSIKISVTYTATPTTYDIVYQPGSFGKGNAVTDVKSYDVPITLQGAIFTHSMSNLHQSGWATTDLGEQAYALGAAYTENANLTLYPVWSPNYHEIVYNLNGGYFREKPLYVATNDVWVSVARPLRTGCLFTGWSVSGISNWQTALYSQDGGLTEEPLAGDRSDYGAGLTKCCFRNLNATDGARISLTANWQEGACSIRYDGNGATGGATDDLPYAYGGDVVVSSNGFTRTGYTFVGWATSAAGPVVYAEGAFLPVFEPKNPIVTLYAKWSPNAYRVAYYSRDGGLTADGKTYFCQKGFTYGTPLALASNTFTRAGYTFVGWATSMTSGAVYSDGQLATSFTDRDNVCVYLNAVWRPNAYTLTFDSSEIGGTGGTTNATVYYQTALPEIQPPEVKVGAFGGYWLGEEKYYDHWGHPLVPTWNFMSDATLIAQYSDECYVEFHANGGEGTMAPMTFEKGEEKPLTSNAFARVGYTFTGWATSETKDVVVYPDGATFKNSNPIGQTLDLYAVWTANVYKVTLKNDNQTIATNFTYGTGPHEIDVSSFNCATQDYTLVQFKIGGETYEVKNGWLTLTDEQVLKIAAAGGTMEAVWKQLDCCYVAFDKNGGEGKMEKQTIDRTTSQPLSANTFTKTGYTFQGWATSANITNVYYQDGASVSNLTAKGATMNLYAVWKANTYHVHLLSGLHLKDSPNCVSNIWEKLTYDGKEQTVNVSSMTNQFHKIYTEFPNYYLNAFTNAQGYAYSVDSFNNRDLLVHLTSDLIAEDGGTINLYAEWEEKMTNYTEEINKALNCPNLCFTINGEWNVTTNDTKKCLIWNSNSDANSYSVSATITDAPRTLSYEYKGSTNNPELVIQKNKSSGSPGYDNIATNVTSTSWQTKHIEIDGGVSEIRFLFADQPGACYLANVKWEPTNPLTLNYTDNDPNPYSGE